MLTAYVLEFKRSRFISALIIKLEYQILLASKEPRSTQSQKMESQWVFGHHRPTLLSQSRMTWCQKGVLRRTPNWQMTLKYGHPQAISPGFSLKPRTLNCSIGELLDWVHRSIFRVQRRIHSIWVCLDATSTSKYYQLVLRTKLL